MRNQKGITIVALAITIAIALVLIGTTVNVALNGGIFDTTKKTKSEAELQQEKEELRSLILAHYNADTGEMREVSLPEGWEKTGKKYYTSPNGNLFKVEDNVEIIYIEDGVIEDDESDVDPWYTITDEEIQELIDKEAEADGNYYIVYAELDDDAPYSFVGIALMTMEEEPICIQVIFVNRNEEEDNPGMWYVMNEELGNMLGLDTGKWYFCQVDSHPEYEGTIEYEGEFPVTVPEEGILCKTYFNRILKSLNK